MRRSRLLVIALVAFACAIAALPVHAWKITGQGTAEESDPVVSRLVGVLCANGTIPFACTDLGNLNTSGGAGSAGRITGAAPSSLGVYYLSTTKTAGATGVTQYLLVKIDATGNVVTASTSDTGILGIAATTATSGSAVEIATRGIIQCTAEITTVVGNMAIVGTSTAGTCRDSGYTSSTSIPITTQIVGKFLSATAPGGLATLQLYGPGHYGTSVDGAIAASNLVPIIISSSDITLTAAQCSGGHVIKTTSSNVYLTNCTTAGHFVKVTAIGAVTPKVVPPPGGVYYLNGSATTVNYILTSPGMSGEEVIITYTGTYYLVEPTPSCAWTVGAM